MSTEDNAAMDNGTSEKKWTFDFDIYYKRKFLGHFFIQREAEYINNLKKRISNIMYAMEKNKAYIMQEILVAGIQALENEIINLGKLDGKDPEFIREWESAIELSRCYAKRNMYQTLDSLYDEKGPIEFQVWCEGHGYSREDLENYMEYRFSDKSALSLVDMDRDWLKSFLAGRGEVPTSEVRKAAEESGIVTSNESWKRLAQVARRMELNNGCKHGYWKV